MAFAAAPALASAGSPSAHAHHASPKPDAAGATWEQLSGATDNIQQPGVWRFGTDLQVAWVQDAGNGEQSLETAVLSSAGAIKAGPVTVLTTDSIDEFPTVLADGGQRVISFAAQAASPTQNTDGYQVIATSTDGVNWSLPGQALSNSANAIGSIGADTDETPSGPVQVYSDGSADAVSYHVGRSAVPTESNNPPDPTTTATGPNALYEGVGDDQSTGAVYAAWFSDAGDQGAEGVLAQQILPSPGNLLHAPGNVSGGSAVVPLNRIDVADRSGGGDYIGYAVGWPAPTKLALWRIGSSTPIVIPDGGGTLDDVDVATGTGGRIWVFWHSESSSVIHIARTNPAATKVGAACSVSTPGHTDSAYAMSGEGSLGPLQLVVDAGSTTQHIYSTVVQPCLSVKASPAKVSNNKTHHVTITVTDAGAPIKKAAVKFGDSQEATNSSGKAVFTVAKGVKKQTIKVQVTAAGYQRAKTKVKVT